MWRHIGGILHAAVATLLEAGWSPVGAYEWTAPDGRVFCTHEEDFLGCPDWSDLFAALHKSLDQRLWEKASSHNHGHGL